MSDTSDSETCAEPVVSVVIPAYNAAPFIADALDSVFAQTFRDFEVIVVNDGSPDTEVLEQAIGPYRDRVVYLKQENRGLAGARNTGIRQARGQFLAFLDADDSWFPEYLAEQMRLFKQAPSLGLVVDPLVEGVYAAANVVCQVSRWQEAFGWTIAEAMACRKPLVATRVGAIPELVKDGETGFLVTPGDAGATAERILQLLGDHGLREHMGAAGRKAVETNQPESKSGGITAVLRHRPSERRGKLNVNSTGKRWIKKSLMATGVLRLASRLRPPAAIVLMYHSVLDDPRECADSIGISSIHSTDSFRKQMEFLAGKYHPVTVEDIRLFLAGQRRLPRRPVAVTFDDGYADNPEVAAPVLNRLGIPASFYLTVESIETGISPWFCHLRHAFAMTRKKSWLDATGRGWELSNEAQRESALSAASEHLTRLVGSPQQEALHAIELDLDTEPLAPKRRLMMTWEQARRLQGEGHVVGSHSLTHPNMAHIVDRDLNYELTESKRKMEHELAMPVVHFSYPAAALIVSWTERTVAASKQAGYETAVTTTRGVVDKGANPLGLCRIGAPGDLDEFRWALQYVPLESIHRFRGLLRERDVLESAKSV